MKRIILIQVFIGLAGLLIQANAQYHKVKVISGVVIDAQTADPLPRSSVYVKDTEIGTVANSAGEFQIKVPIEFENHTLVISSVGYDSFEGAVKSIAEENNRFKLTQVSYMMGEVVISNSENILIEAIKRIPLNYPREYQHLTTFYREMIKKNNSYVDISQGILEITKSPYGLNNADEVSIYKGHRAMDYKPNDTLAFKVMGGPSTMMMLDLVKNPGVVYGMDMFEFYEYTYKGIQSVDGRRNYVLGFTQKPDVEYPLYEGVIYIDEETFAITGFEFGYNDTWLNEGAKMLVKQRPLLASLTPEKVRYEVRYRESGGLWYLYFVRNELVMKCDWKRKLFNSRFSSMSELVVTDKEIIQKENVIKGAKELLSKPQDLFSDKVNELYDTEYWEDFSIIKPEEELEKALDKIEGIKRRNV